MKGKCSLLRVPPGNAVEVDPAAWDAQAAAADDEYAAVAQLGLARCADFLECHLT